jgi:hypothetical protein
MRNALLLGLVLLAGGCSKTPGGVETSGPESLYAPAVSIQSSLAYEPVGERRVGMARQVTVDFTLEGAPKDAEVVVEFRSPGDVPFERRKGRLVASGAMQQRVEFTLPVAGTVIDASSLSGAWTANLIIGGAPVASQDFELAP